MERGTCFPWAEAWHDDQRGRPSRAQYTMHLAQHRLQVLAAVQSTEVAEHMIEGKVPQLVQFGEGEEQGMHG
jgi:hypothetical protein